MFSLPIGTCPFTHPFIHTSIHHKFIPLTLFRRLAMFVHSFNHSLVAHSNRMFFFFFLAIQHTFIHSSVYSHTHTLSCQPERARSLIYILMTYSNHMLRFFNQKMFTYSLKFAHHISCPHTQLEYFTYLFTHHICCPHIHTPSPAS